MIPSIKLIAAVDNSGSIGWSDGRLPWKIPGDLARFKQLTTGSTVLMGRKTFESLGRPAGLPHRRNVVASHGIVRYDPSVEVVNDPIAWAATQPEPLWVIGGAQVYREFLVERCVDEIHLTRVLTSSNADIKFPFNVVDLERFIQIDRAFGINWEITYKSDVQKTGEGLEYYFVTLRNV